MPSLEPSTVAASYAHAVWSAVPRGAPGEDPGAVPDGGPGGPGRWASPTERLSFSEVRGLWRRVLGADEAEPHMGLRVGERLRPADLHVLGHVVLTSGSLGEAAEAAVRYHPLVSQAGTVALHRDGELRRLRYRPTVGPEAMHSQQVEAIVTGMVTAARWVAGDDWAPVSVSFAHSRTGSPEPYARVLGCPVVFGAAEHEITLADADLARRRAPCDPELNALHRTYADRLLRELRVAVPLRERVRQWLEYAPLDGSGPGEPSRELHLSPRTLRRMLREEGTSWRELLDGARRARVRLLLETTTLPLERIAGAVGLSGATVLVRAFTRWEGITPGAYRRLHPVDPSAAPRRAAGTDRSAPIH